MAKKDVAQPEQRYVCDRAGCDKSYSRPDHLLRHKLNHDVDRVLCCNQCDRTWSNKLKGEASAGGGSGSGSRSSRPRSTRRGSKAAKISHNAEDSDGEDLDPALSGVGLPGNPSHLDHNSEVGFSSASQLHDPTRYPSLAEAGPPPSMWSSYAVSPLGMPGASRSGGAAMAGGSGGGYQASWSPQAASAATPSASALSPPFRRNANAPYEPYQSGSTDNIPSSRGTVGYDGKNQGGSLASSRGPLSVAEANEIGRGASNSGAGGSYDAFSVRHLQSWRNEGASGLENPGRGGIGVSAGGSSEPDFSSWMEAGEVGGNNDAVAESVVRLSATDALGGREGGGNYAPPPSDSFYPGWPEADGAPASHAGRGGHDDSRDGGRGGGGPVAAAAEEGSGNGTSAADASRQGLIASQAFPMTNQDLFPFAPPAIDHTADYGWLFDGMDPFGSSGFSVDCNRLGTSRGQSQTSSFSPSSSDGLGGFLGSLGGGSQSGAGAGVGRLGGGGETASFGRGMSSDGMLLSGSEAETPNALEDLAYFASLQAEIPSKVTYHVDPVAHHRLLVFLSSVSELPHSPLFTPSALRCYVYLFFAKFNRLYPLIHEPTFAASSTDPMLLSAVVVVGAHFAAFPSHEMAVRIAQKIWGAIVSLEDFRPARATLPMLQAMVVTECFGKMMSTRPQHEMAHLFHNFIITLARRNAVFNPSVSGQARYEESEDHWRAWAREEEKKRIALFAFMLDAQHATTFRHVPALSAFQIQLNLPCSDDEWSKPSPAAWVQHRKRASYRSPSPFIPALKACLSPGKTPQELDAFSRFVLLHGLMSIAYDLHWKQDILLGAENNAFASGRGSDGGGIGNWKDRLSAAYSSLQARMDIAFIKAEDDSSTRSIHRATPSLVSAGQITLFADIIDIQIYAGLPSVLGRFIDRATFNASRRSVKEWAKTLDGRTAVWHAVNFLKTSLLGSGTEAFGAIQPWKTNQGDREVVERDDASHQGSPPAGRKGADRDAGLDEVLHHRWCQYLCALVIWAHGHALAASRGSQLSTSSNTGPSTSARAGKALEAPFPLQGPYTGHLRRDTTGGSRQPLKPEAVEFLERMCTKSPEGIATVDCKYYTKSVLELVERQLRGSRWELGREASGVLRKLIQNHALPHWDRGDAQGTGSSSRESSSTGSGSNDNNNRSSHSNSNSNHKSDGIGDRNRNDVLGSNDGHYSGGKGQSGSNAKGKDEDARQIHSGSTSSQDDAIEGSLHEDLDSNGPQRAAEESAPDADNGMNSDSPGLSSQEVTKIVEAGSGLPPVRLRVETVSGTEEKRSTSDSESEQSNFVNGSNDAKGDRAMAPLDAANASHKGLSSRSLERVKDSPPALTSAFGSPSGGTPRSSMASSHLGASSSNAAALRA